VTVLFSDASGYTSLAEHLDPELVREVMGEVYASAREIVERYGGRVDKLMGDAVLAVFGDPVAHEDDAERAVRAALDLHVAVRAMAPSLEARVGRSFEMHSGINTGVIVASDSREDRESGPLGDMVNVAARLQSFSETGEIIVGAETIALVGSTFELEDLGEVQLKGRSASVGAAGVMGVAGGGGAAGDVGPSRRSGDFVGRQEELGSLLGVIDLMRDGASSVVTVSAEAGAGKTRLFEEIHSRLGDVSWVEGRAYPYTSNVPYAPIVDLLSRAGGVDESDEPGVVRTKLETLIDGLVPGDAGALAVISQLFGVHVGDDIDLEAFGEQMTTALGRLLAATATRGPTVVCFQDPHWVDPSTAELIRTLAREVSPPRVTVCNFRPNAEFEIDDARRIDLGELSPRQTREQLASLLDHADPPEELVSLVLERAEGNPFFAEEIGNSLLDQALLTVVDGDWVLICEGAAQPIPPTVRGLLASRIDILDSQRKQVLREASVVGREFLHRIVQSVAGDPGDLDGSLEVLSAVDLIRVKEQDPELEYIFKHALIQEVAHESLVTRDRQRLHGQVARSLETHLVIGPTRLSRRWRSTINAAATSTLRSGTCASQAARHSRRMRCPRRTATTAARTNCSHPTPFRRSTRCWLIGCSSRRCSTGATRSTTEETSTTSRHFKRDTNPSRRQWVIRACSHGGRDGAVSQFGWARAPSSKRLRPSKNWSRRRLRAAM